MEKKINQIKDEIKRTQKNKATEHHLGMLKAQLAKLENISIKKKIRTYQGFEIKKTCKRVVLIGFPSVGKSTLLSRITGAFSEQSELEFTTLGCIPGKLHLSLKDLEKANEPIDITRESNERQKEYLNITDIEILDLPGILPGANKNIGKGKRVLSVSQTADLIILLLDIRRNDKELLMEELEQYDLHNKKIIYCYNKIDELSIDEFVRRSNNILLELGVSPPAYISDNIPRFNSTKTSTDSVDYTDNTHANNNQYCFISCAKGWNLNKLKLKIWNSLDLIRIYTKKQGEQPSMDRPVVLDSGSTLKDFCYQIHKSLEANFKYGLLWGQSGKHYPQKIGLKHVLMDDDVVQIVLNT